MSVHLFTITFEATTAIPADNVVNTWYFEGSGTDPQNVGDMLSDFYDVAPTGETVGISSFMSDDALTGDYTIRAYDLSDPEPRAPVYEWESALAGISTQPQLPDEVALVFSYHSALASGVPAGRRRGRIYLGGLRTGAADGARPSAAIRAVMAASGRDLIQASNASVSWQWQQYSRTTSTGNVVVGGWIDDAWDTQRRRGRDASTRTLFTGGTP